MWSISLRKHHHLIEIKFRKRSSMSTSRGPWLWNYLSSFLFCNTEEQRNQERLVRSILGKKFNYYTPYRLISH
jgi:hypothetical protein